MPKDGRCTYKNPILHERHSMAHTHTLAAQCIGILVLQRMQSSSMRRIKSNHRGGGCEVVVKDLDINTWLLN